MLPFSPNSNWLQHFTACASSGKQHDITETNESLEEGNDPLHRSAL